MKKEHPILFSAEMVNAILAGRKTMTRRIIKPQPEDGLHDHTRFPMSLQSDLQGWWGVTEQGESRRFNCPYGEPGDLLWVRESFLPLTIGCAYKADGLIINEKKFNIKWKPSIHMPKAAARLWLEVISVRVERLHDMPLDDAKLEGVELLPNYRWKHYAFDHNAFDCPTAFHSFKSLWIKINGEENWNENPFVWVVEFETKIKN